MWHQVKSYGIVNRAVAFLFSQFNEKDSIDTSDCSLNPDAITLSEVDVDLQYPGKGPMYMGNSELNVVIKELKEHLVDKKKGYITLKSVYRMILSNHQMGAKKKKLLVNKTKLMYNHFLELAGGNQENMNQSFLESLTRKQFRPVYLWLFPMEPANNYEHEYAYFLPEEIQEKIEELRTSNSGTLKKDVFMEEYENMGGTRKFAEEFWTNLAGSLDTSEVSDISETLEKALMNYDLYRREDPEQDQHDGDSTIVTPQGHVSQPKRESNSVYHDEDVNEEAPQRKEEL